MQGARGARSRAIVLPACLLAVALAACESVVVSMVEVSGVEVFPASITLMAGESATASAIVTESTGSELPGLPVTWTVEDPRIASVTDEGVVHALAPGTTTVRASSEGVSGSAIVRVLAVETPDPEPDPSCDLRDRVIVGTFEVPRNARCTLTDVRVLGSVVVRDGGSLVGTRLSVSGNLDADRAAALVLDEAEFFGEVRFEKGGDVTIRDSDIERKLTLRSNLGAIAVSDSRVDDALELEENRGGPFTLYRNTAEKLDCKANDPAPIGEGNVVDGSGGGQCRDL